MALVVDSDDDKRSVGGVTENTLNDPTFIARPGSGLKLTCPELGNGSLEIPVKGYSHRVRINHIWAGDAFEGSAEPQTGNIILAEFENRWRCPEIYAQAHIRIDEEHANNDIDPETVYADNKFTESEYATLIEKVDELGLPESVMKIVWVPRRIQPLLINDETKQLTDALFGKNLQGNPGNHRKDIVVLFLYNLAQSDLSAKKYAPTMSHEIGHTLRGAGHRENGLAGDPLPGYHLMAEGGGNGIIDGVPERSGKHWYVKETESIKKAPAEIVPP